MNMIIGKKQIILASLVLGLGVAVYLNWTYSKTELSAPAANHAMQDTDDEGTYGEAQYVEDEVTDVVDAEVEAETFFVEAKLSRQKARDEAVETLASMLQDAELSTDQRSDLAVRATDIAKSIETEGKIENLIKAKGFADVMVYYDSMRADIIIKTNGLVAEEAAQIKDIILKETSIAPENISIVEVN